LDNEDTIIAFLSNYSPEISTLAASLRRFLLKNLTGIREQLDIKAKIIAFGYGAGYKDNICNILLSKSGVKLGLNKGAELSDPAKLLTGSGKVHKYAEIKSERDIKSSALKKLLTEAVKAYKVRIS